MKLKKYLLILLILGVTVSCEMSYDNELFHRYIIKLDTNIDSLRIGDTFISRNIIYPYDLLNLYQPHLLSTQITVYPVSDTGQINFYLYGGDGYDDIPKVNFLDSLNLYTPIDTTVIVFRSGNGIDTIIVNPN